MWINQNTYPGTSLNQFILEQERKQSKPTTGSLSIALTCLETATKIISFHIRRAGINHILGQTDQFNIHGEKVQKLDQFANNVLINYLAASGQFQAIASEESEHIITPQTGQNGRYIIAIDPLDGSSNLQANIGTGTIFSIFSSQKSQKSQNQPFFQKPKYQVAAGYLLYASSTILVYSTGNGVNGFTLDPNVGTFFLSHPNITIPQFGKTYSFHEAKTHLWQKPIQKYIQSLKSQQFRSRYIGSMVADIHNILLTGGIFGYPSDPLYPNGKLRILYETSPMSFLIQQAGGLGTTGTSHPLHIQPSHIHQTSPIFLGSPQNIQQLLQSFEKYPP